MSNDIDIVKVDEYPIDDSIKLWGMPGTGKTTQATERLKKNIEKFDYGIDDITLCTYRRSLSFEILEKLKEEGLIKDNVKYSDTYIGTIHGVCKRLVDNSNVNFDFNNFADSSDKEDFVSKFGKKYNNSSYEKSEGEVLFDIISYIYSNKTDNIPYSLRENFYERWESTYNVNELFKKWQEYKKENNLKDFDDLLYIVKKENLIPPNKFIFIDEYHDAYPLLDDVVRNWVEETKKDENTVIIAGDPLQVINNYQGASPEFFKDIELPEVVLNKTYRCPEEVWNKSLNTLLKEYNQSDIPDIQTSDKSGFVKEINKTVFRKDLFGSWNITDSDYNPYHMALNNEDIMFLVRTRYQIKPIVQNLKNKGIIYSAKHKNSWDKDIDKLKLYNAITKIVNMEYEGEEFDKVKGFKYKLKNNTYLKNDELDIFLYYLDDKYLYNNYENIKIDKYNYYVNVEELHQILHKEIFNMNKKELVNNLSISEYYYKEISRALKNYNKPFNKYNLPVQVRTIHESKGLESKNVVLYDSITKEINNITDTKNRKNECRVWFVGITRASENLYIFKNSFKDNKYKTKYL